MSRMHLDPGELRTEMILQKAETSSDGTGGHTENWVEVATVFARVEPLRAQSRFGAGQYLESVTHRVTLRFREDVRSGMRFLKHGRTLEIINVQDADESGRYLICYVREEGR
jgi:phage head-tail adaptor, putative, SPP1 family